MGMTTNSMAKGEMMRCKKCRGKLTKITLSPFNKNNMYKCQKCNAIFFKNFHDKMVELKFP